MQLDSIPARWRVPALLLTAAYLAGPLLIAGELLQPVLSVPLLLLAAAWFTGLAIPANRGRASHADEFAEHDGRRARWHQHLATAALAIALIYLSGIGGFSLCRWDYVKHNILFTELLRSRLPILLDQPGGPFILHYALAYYILPVRLTQLLQRLTPDISLDAVLATTYALALFTSVRLLAGRTIAPFALLALLAFAGGLDVLGMIAFGVPANEAVRIPLLGIGAPMNMEWWGAPFAPQAGTAHLFWAPQHFFGALIGTALLAFLMRSERPAVQRLCDVVVLICASAFWSPYVAIGLAALAGVQLAVTDRTRLLSELRQNGLVAARSWRSWSAAAFGAGMAAFALLFFLAAQPLSPPQFLWSSESLGKGAGTFALNYGLFLAAVALALVQRGRQAGGASPRRFAGFMVACLLASAVLLSFAHGRYNDWAMRTTIPLWIALLVCLARLLPSLPRAARVLLLVLMLLSSGSALAEISQSLFIRSACAPYGAFGIDAMGELAAQYQGRADSLLYRSLVRRPVAP